MSTQISTPTAKEFDARIARFDQLAPMSTTDDLAWVPREAWEIFFAQKILESLKNNTTLKKFIFASSSSVYGNQSSIMNEDTSLTKPVSPYGVTKLAAENLVNLYFKNYEIPTISLRYFTVYGPRQRPDMAFSRFFRSIIKDKKLTIFGNPGSVVPWRKFSEPTGLSILNSSLTVTSCFYIT